MINNKKRIYLIDNDTDLLDYLAKKLEQDGFLVNKFSSGLKSINDQSTPSPDAIVMDLNLDNVKGTTLLKELQFKYHKSHILILTDKDSTDTIVKSFELGAEDFITKPFDYKVLKVRLEARLVSSSKNKKKESFLNYKDISIDTNKKRVFKNDERLNLSEKEYSLLKFLVKHQGKVFSRDQLLDRVWGMEKYVVTRTIDVYIGRLRKKLAGNDEEYIKTRRGFGYIMPVE